MQDLQTFFSHSVGCFLIVLVISFALQKLFSLMQLSLLILAFVAFASGGRPKTSLTRPVSRSSSVLSLSNFMLSGSAFVSLIHFVLMFYIWCKTVVQFHSFVCVYGSHIHILFRFSGEESIMPNKFSYFYCKNR